MTAKNYPSVSYLFDYAELSFNLKGNRKLISSICEEFIARIHHLILQLNSAIEAKDQEKIISYSHNIKGSSATFRCKALSQVASDIEEALKINDFKLQQNLASKLMTYFIETKQVIEKYINV